MESGSNSLKWSQLARQFFGEDFWSDVMGAIPDSVPKADVYHTRNEVIVLVDLPGIEDINQLELRIDGQQLLIKGTIPSRYDQLKVAVSERPKGEFERSIPLGAWVTRRNGSARYRRGVLEVRLPKVPASKHARIRVRDS